MSLSVLVAIVVLGIALSGPHVRHLRGGARRGSAALWDRQEPGHLQPLKVAFHEWIGMFRDAFAPGLTPRERLNYLIKPPGWSHDGSRDTSEMLKAAYVRRNPGEAGKPGLPAAGLEAAE